MTIRYFGYLFTFLVLISPVYAATKTLCTVGCDYNDCSTWVTYLQGRSPLSEAEILEVTGSFTGHCTITGVVTSAANYIDLGGVSACRHSAYYAASKCELTDTTDGHIVYVGVPHVRVHDLIITQGHASNCGILVEEVAGGEIQIYNNVIRKTAETPTAGDGIWVGITGVGTGTTKIWNNIVYDFYAAGIRVDIRDNDKGVVYNNTTYGNGEAGIRIICENGSSGRTLRLQNNIADTNTTADYVYNGSCDTETKAYNLSSDTTGSVGLQEQDPIYEDEVGNDFRLDSTDTAATNLGTDLSADGDLAITDDINATLRPQGVAYDLGAFESIATGVSIPAILIQDGWL